MPGFDFACSPQVFTSCSALGARVCSFLNTGGGIVDGVVGYVDPTRTDESVTPNECLRCVELARIFSVIRSAVCSIRVST